jgi:hypothetical protein
VRVRLQRAIFFRARFKILLLSEVARDPHNLTPNPFPSGKGNWILEERVARPDLEEREGGPDLEEREVEPDVELSSQVGFAAVQ